MKEFKNLEKCVQNKCVTIPLECIIYNCHFKTVVKKSKEIIIIKVLSGQIEFLNIYLEL